MIPKEDFIKRAYEDLQKLRTVYSNIIKEIQDSIDSNSLIIYDEWEKIRGDALYPERELESYLSKGLQFFKLTENKEYFGDFHFHSIYDSINYDNPNQTVNKYKERIKQIDEILIALKEV